MGASLAATPVATARVDASSKAISFTTPRDVAYGNTMIVALSLSGTAAAGTWTATAAGGLTWTVDRVTFNATVAQTVLLSAPVTLAGGIPAGTVLTFSVGSGDGAFTRLAGILAEANGILQAAYADQTGSANANSAAPSVTAAAATAQADELLVGAFGLGSVPVFTVTGGAAALPPVSSTAATTNKQVVLAYKSLTAIATPTIGGTLDVSTQWVGALVTYKGGAAPAPPTPTQSIVAGAVATGRADAATKTLTLTTLRDVPAGSTVLLALGCSAVITPSTLTVTDPTGAAWRLDKQSDNGSLLCALFSAPLTAKLPAGSLVKVTCDNSLARWSATMMEMVGTSQAAGYTDRAVAGSGGSTTTPSITDTVATVQAGEMLVGAFALGASPVFTQAAGFTLDPGAASTAATTNKQVVLEHKALAATGVQSVSGILDTATAWVGVLVSYKAGVAAQATTGRWVLRSGVLVAIPQRQTLRAGVLR